MEFLEKLLNAYHLSIDEYHYLTRELSLSDLEKPDNFLDMEKAIERIKKAMINQEKIMIYGDYDCDGISATSILVKTFQKLNYMHVGYYIPSRYIDGYGINVDRVNQIASKGYRLIITVDNGVAQEEALTLAKEKNIDVILTDHHEIVKSVPPCYCLLHPTMKKDSTNLPECGGYVAFMLASRLLNGYDPYLLSLASLSTISDMMPLRSYNRDIVRLGIHIMKKNHYEEYAYLLENKELNDEKSLSFIIAPKINAVGRLIEDYKVNKLIEYFTSEDTSKIQVIGKFIEDTNEKRKVLSQEALKTIQLDKYQNQSFIVIRVDTLSEGLVGLLANRIINEVKKPVVVFTKDHQNGLLKGSARSLEGLSIIDTFGALNDIIEQYGGHELAGGLSIKEENYEIFTNRINEIAKNSQMKEKQKIIIPVETDELNLNNYQIIRSLSPFGQDFDEPYFQINYPCKNISYLSNGKHIKGSINEKCSFISFNTNQDFGKSGYVSLIGRLLLDEYWGNNKLQLVVDQIIKD